MNLQKSYDLEKHLTNPLKAETFEGKLFEFYNKPDMRIYHPSQERVFLVHDIGGKWLHWGKVHIIQQTINAETRTISGK